MLKANVRDYGLATAIIVLASPALMSLLGLASFFDWSLLSNIGQSFGGVSALLSAVALLALARSNRLLQSQNQVNLDQTTRDMQFRILEIALGDPELQLTYATDDLEAGLTLRQSNFLTMRFRYFQYAYLHGALSDTGLSTMLKVETFPAPLTREYWSTVNDIWAAQATGDRERKFVEITNRAQEEFGPTEVSASE